MSALYILPLGGGGSRAGEQDKTRQLISYFGTVFELDKTNIYTFFGFRPPVLSFSVVNDALHFAHRHCTQAGHPGGAVPRERVVRGFAVLWRG